MQHQLTPTIEHAARDEVKRQLNYSPEFSPIPTDDIDQEIILQDVLNRLPPASAFGSADGSLSFFQRERLREIVHETIREHIGGKTPDSVPVISH